MTVERCGVTGEARARATDFDACVAALLRRERASCDVERKAFVDALKARGEKHLGTGASRATYSLGEACVIKIAKGPMEWKRFPTSPIPVVGDHGLLNNQLEGNAWRRIKQSRDPKLVRLFVPIIEQSPMNTYLVLPRARPPADAMEAASAVFELENDLNRVGAYCDDLNEDNVGFIRDRPVILDYATNAFRCSTTRRRRA